MTKLHDEDRRSQPNQITHAKLAICIVNFETPQLTIDCLASLDPEVRQLAGSRAVVVDNASADDSAERIEAAIESRGWSDWVSFVQLDLNRGFSAGNNAAIDALRRKGAFDAFVLLNSDTLVRPEALRRLSNALQSRPRLGFVGPRLEWSDGAAQMSCFRYPSPLTEFLTAASTGPISRLFGARELPLAEPRDDVEIEWISFACVAVRPEVLDEVGPLDENYFMYFEDVDYCRRARKMGWEIDCEPAARVVHLRGCSSEAEFARSSRKRRPKCYYESRARYFVTYYGRPGLWLANLLWSAGRCISGLRELVGNKAPHTCQRESLDIWIGCLSAPQVSGDPLPTSLPAP